MKHIINRSYLPHHVEFTQSLARVKDEDFEKELDAVIVYRWQTETVEVRFRVWQNLMIAYSGMSLDEAINHYNRIE